MSKKTYMKKLLSVLIAVAVAVTFIPLLGSDAYADEALNEDSSEISVGLGDAQTEDGEIKVEGKEDETSGLTEDHEEDETKGIDITDGSSDVIDSEDVSADETPVDSSNAVMSTKDMKVKAQALSSNDYDLKLNQNGNTVTLSGTINHPFSPAKLYLDTQDREIGYNWSINGRTTVFPYNPGERVTIEATINMANYTTGYHSLFLQIRNGNTVVSNLRWKYLASNTISAKPNYGGAFTVYSNSMAFRPFNNAGGNYNPYSFDQPKLYLEYRTDKKGSKWQRSTYMQYGIGPDGSSQSFGIGGLKTNTKYKTRIRFGEVVTYKKEYGGDGKAYFFGGPLLNTKTIKTGKAKAPSIRKVTAKAVKVKKHKNAGSKYYTYNVKVTVKLKKKPGTKGICVNGRFLKGNKKRYTTTFKIKAVSPKKPKGRAKYTVTVQSAHSSKYGGYSPAWSKVKKLS